MTLMGDDMERLKGSITYLCGPIDNVEDDGVIWRKQIGEILSARYGMKILDPTDKPFKNQTLTYEEIGVEKTYAHTLKAEGRYAELAEKFKGIVRADLRCVDLSDVLIAYLPKDVLMCGTIHEIVVSTESKKPTLLVVEGGRKNLSHWFWGIIPSEPHTENRSGWIFDSWDALFDYLDEINQAEEVLPEPKSSRWVMLDVGSR
ncbi:MAG: hypothetical protein CML44_03425 [Rhodobacteraceae bacterium]|nr:hypothetical protein [Paracoccaceae bacterium]